MAAIRQVIRAVDLHSRSLMDQCGLTGPQLATLQAAGRLGPVSGGALSRAVHLGQPTVSGILSRLELRGLVTRTRGEPDRRTVTVEVTAAGRAMLAHAPSLLQDRFREQLERLDDWERHMTLSVLQRVARMMGAESLDAAPHLTPGAALGSDEPVTDPLSAGTPSDVLTDDPGDGDGVGTDAAPPAWPWRQVELDGPPRD